MNSKQYRDFYESKTNKKIPSGFDVHHIDQNRSNNDITNLVAIPKIVHKEYHNNLNIYEISLNSLDINIHSNPMVYDFYLENINKYAVCCKLIKYFIMYRDALILGHNNSPLGHNYNTDFSQLINELE